MAPIARTLKSTALASQGLDVERVASLIVDKVKRLSEPSPIEVNLALWHIQQLYRVEASRGLASGFSAILTSFINTVVSDARVIYARSGYKGATKSWPELPAAFHEAVWESAMQSATAKTAIESGLALTSIHEKVTGETYDKVSDLLGSSPTSIGTSEVSARSKGRLAGALRSILETTKKGIRAALKGVLAAKRGVQDILTGVKAGAEQRVRNRLGTISRTEAVKATNAGVTLSARHSWVATHVSVVGCTVIEVNGPLFKGFPTCNIKNVPVRDEGGLEFHINHTGFFVISGFALPDGTAPQLVLSGG